MDPYLNDFRFNNMYAPNSLKNRFNPNITKVCTAQFTGLNKIIFTQLFTRRHGTKSLNI